MTERRIMASDYILVKSAVSKGLDGVETCGVMVATYLGQEATGAIMLTADRARRIAADLITAAKQIENGTPDVAVLEVEAGD